MKPCRNGEVAKLGGLVDHGEPLGGGEHRAQVGALLQDAPQPRQHHRRLFGDRQQLLRLVHQQQHPPAALDGAARQCREHVGHREALELVDLDVGGAAERVAVLDALQQAVGQPAGVAAALQVPVERRVGRLRILQHAVLELLQEAGLAEAACTHHPQRVAFAVEDLAHQGPAAEEVLAAHPAAGDVRIARFAHHAAHSLRRPLVRRCPPLRRGHRLRAPLRRRRLRRPPRCRPR